MLSWRLPSAFSGRWRVRRGCDAGAKRYRNDPVAAFARMQAQDLECVGNDRFCRLGAIAVAPIRSADPVTDFRPFVCPRDLEPDGAQQDAVLRARNCKDNRLALLIPSRKRTEPFLRHAVEV